MPLQIASIQPQFVALPRSRGVVQGQSYCLGGDMAEGQRAGEAVAGSPQGIAHHCTIGRAVGVVHLDVNLLPMLHT